MISITVSTPSLPMVIWKFFRGISGSAQERLANLGIGNLVRVFAQTGRLLLGSGEGHFVRGFIFANDEIRIDDILDSGDQRRAEQRIKLEQDLSLNAFQLLAPTGIGRGYD